MAGGDMRGRGCAWQGGHSWQEGMHGTGACMAEGMHGMHTPTSRYYKIRSMSGQYASYWNAFLYHILSQGCYRNTVKLRGWKATVHLSRDKFLYNDSILGRHVAICIGC